MASYAAMVPLEDDPGLRASIAKIWANGRDRAVGRVDAIDRAVAALRGGALDDDLRAEARGEAHKLAGALGSFGMPEGTEHARALEQALEGEPAAADADELAEHAAGLRRVVEAGPG